MAERFFRCWFFLFRASRTLLAGFGNHESGLARRAPCSSPAKQPECNGIAEYCASLPACLGIARPSHDPCPRRLPRMKSRALPFKVIQERGLRDLASPTSIKGADSNPVPPPSRFVETWLAETGPSADIHDTNAHHPVPGPMLPSFVSRPGFKSRSRRTGCIGGAHPVTILEFHYRRPFSW